MDAFRHAYWMARLRQEIGKTAARSLGKAHEKENYQTFKKFVEFINKRFEYSLIFIVTVYLSHHHQMIF